MWVVDVNGGTVTRIDPISYATDVIPVAGAVEHSGPIGDTFIGTAVVDRTVVWVARSRELGGIQ